MKFREPYILAPVVVTTVGSHPISKAEVPLRRVWSIHPLPTLLELVLPANRADAGFIVVIPHTGKKAGASPAPDILTMCFIPTLLLSSSRTSEVTVLACTHVVFSYVRVLTSWFYLPLFGAPPLV